MRGMGGHHSAAAGKDEWLTPPRLLRALGPFDLDPCAASRWGEWHPCGPLHVRPWPTARHHVSAPDDGLRTSWFGRVWCNPPYGREAAAWLERMAAHGRGTALVFARTETDMFFAHVWPRATALLFLQGRLHFHHFDGRRAPANSGAPSVLIAYGERDAAALERADLAGAFIRLQASMEDMG